MGHGVDCLGQEEGKTRHRVDCVEKEEGKKGMK
jgi:hypothetical protein